MHLDLCNESCSSGRRTSWVAIASTLDVARKRLAMLMDTEIRYERMRFTSRWWAAFRVKNPPPPPHPPPLPPPIYFCLLHHFHWSRPCLGVIRSAQNKNLLASFSHCSTDQGEISSGVEGIQVEHPDTTFQWYLKKQGGVGGGGGGGECFIDYVKKLWRWYALGRLWIDLVKTWYDGRYYCALHMILV